MSQGQTCSMTGFGKATCSGENFELTAEIKSVNHRFKDYRFRTPSLLNSLEFPLRKKLEKAFSRGSFEVSLSYKRAETNQKNIVVDLEKVDKFLKSVQPLFDYEGVDTIIRPTDFLRNEFAVDESAEKEVELTDLAKQAAEKAIEALSLARKEEGHKLENVLLENLQGYEKTFQIIIDNREKIEEQVLDNLNSKFEELKLQENIEKPRFLQEIVYYLEKLDINEEIDRVKIHLEKFKRLLKDGGEKGRKIEFLTQELGRETNTIGSKSSLSETSEAVVQLKVYLEKIREQALNIE